MEDVKEDVIETTEPVEKKEVQETQDKNFMQHMKDFFLGSAKPKEDPAAEKKEEPAEPAKPKTEAVSEQDVQKLITEERQKWENEKAEEERLKKLSPEEREKAEQESVKKELEATKSKLKEKEFKEVAISSLTEKGYPVTLANILPYSAYKDQKEMETALNDVTTVFENALKEVLLSKVKQTTPKGLHETSAPIGDAFLKQIDEAIKKGGF